MKINLGNICLICIDCINYSTAIIALQKSMQQCDFASVKFLTDIDINVDGIEVGKIPRINSKEEYSHFCIKELWKHFDTDFVMIVQHDGYVISGDAWNFDFLDYDYCAPKWTYMDGKNVGCGGASIRSKKLQYILGTDNFIFATDPEDQAIGRLYRDYLIKGYGITFATEDVADRFGYELNAPYRETFCFHNYFHLPFKNHIVLKRTASMGDLIMLESIISYYCGKGYQVVLDTIHEFMQLFSRYKYKILHISEMDNRIVPVKRINFDMSYESKPQQLVLKSYIELTGENIPLSNSKLYFPVADNAFIFQNYILIHIDETGMPHRNCQGVNWAFVVAYYQKLGYLVFQIGKRMNEQVAPYMNTPNIESLMFMIKGCRLLIGIDSSPSQIAVALDVPAVIFFGSVNPAMRYHSFENIEVIHSKCVKPEDDFCYHNEISTVGVKCKYNELSPPCSVYSEKKVIKSANKLLNIK